MSSPLFWGIRKRLARLSGTAEECLECSELVRDTPGDGVARWIGAYSHSRLGSGDRRRRSAAGDEELKQGLRLKMDVSLEE